MLKKLFIIGLSLFFLNSLAAQNNKPRKKKVIPPFKWVNTLPENRKVPGLEHSTFKSSSMGIDVGYCIYLPPQYKSEESKKFPVVYYLHGGRPGSEIKSVRMASYVHKAMSKNEVKPMIYVFVNGGPVSHYNYPQKENGLGEDVFIKELIPHIDSKYRTVADKKGRGLEGFSQGGRGTARIMFKHPHLFYSCSPGGGGFATEKRISESGGRESEKLIFAEGYNAYDLARAFKKKDDQNIKILFHVGTKGFNYQNNLEYMKFMDSLEISYGKVIVDGAEHSAAQIYDKKGLEIMKFHSENLHK
ncbi:MAG: esterase family protein [Lentisphaeraceae bacterium]|nr:esterase family protein [Lentisphaeraceae bacterium]